MLEIINGDKVLIATTTYDGYVVNEYCGGLMAAGARHMFGNVAFMNGLPHRMARNSTFHGFYRKSLFEWLVCIDSDIGFTPEDLALLLSDPEKQPEGVSTTKEGRALMVNAEYCKHNFKGEIVSFGLGFTRIHRSVFKIMEDSLDGDGNPRIGQFYFYSEVMSDYCPEGPSMDGKWSFEDHGFWHVVRLSGIVPRIERGTRLTHFGRAGFPYPPSSHTVMHHSVGVGREGQADTMGKTLPIPDVIVNDDGTLTDKV